MCNDKKMNQTKTNLNKIKTNLNKTKYKSKKLNHNSKQNPNRIKNEAQSNLERNFSQTRKEI